EDKARKERGHINLKSDSIDKLTAAQARARGKKYREQAIRNTKHLPDKPRKAGDESFTPEPIVLDFAEPGTDVVRDAICGEVFKEGSPVTEVRFHTRTVTRKEWREKQKAIAAKAAPKKVAAPAKKGKAAPAKKGAPTQPKKGKAPVAKKDAPTPSK